MIAGIFHEGSGLGNQLHRYVATRVLALDKGYYFSMVAPENFKGSSFMKLDMGIQTGILVAYDTEMPSGKVIPRTSYSPFSVWEEKTNYYNPEFNFVEDNTIIDGEFQDERYFEHRLPEVDKWLEVEPIEMQDDLCVIGFRGGEYSLFPELFLTPQYWYDAQAKIWAKYGCHIRFEVHTDDLELARKFFPLWPVVHDISLNWRSMRYAKYAIIANSSFYILPRLLNGGVTIAPRYWARRNIKEWSMPQNYYKSFQYI